MILKHAAGNFAFDLPEPPPKIRTPPEGWKPFDDWKELSGVIALDLETNDPGLAHKLGSSWARPGEGQVCGFSIAHESQSFYAGVGHDGGNVDVDKAWSWLRHHAAKPDVTFVYANCIYDLGWLLREGIEPATPPEDVAGMAALLDEGRPSYSLDSLLRDYLGRAKGTGGLFAKAKSMGIINPYVNMHRMPAWIVDEYGVDDAVDTLELRHKLQPLLEAEDLMRVWNLERECYLVGRDLRWRGVRVDLDEAARVKDYFKRQRDEAVEEIFRLTGVNVAPNDNHSIGRALKAENPALVMEETSRGVPVVQAAQIEALQTPVSRAVRVMRKMDKAVGTFVEGYIERFTGRDSRIHAEFHPLRKSFEDKEGGGNAGAGPGRWSSSGPNMQNIPRRDVDTGPAIRRCFLPEEGEEWLKADYSSQEPRMSTHFAYLARGWVDWKGRWHVPLKPGDPREALPRAAEMVDKYLANPTMSFHKEVGKAMGLGTSGPLYDALKINNLALIYGMSGRTFAINNGYATKWIKSYDGTREIEVAGDEAQALLDKHAAAVPWGKPLAALAKEAAELRGYTKTILGRRIRYQKRYADGNLMDVHKALNNSVQGSAADQMKSAQVLFRRAGINPLVVVHDDGNFSKPLGEAGERMMAQVSEIMAEAIKLSVPSLAEMKVGKTWGDV